MEQIHGEVLRSLRLGANLTTKALAEKSKVSQQTIENIEKGKSKHVTDATLIGLAAGLGMGTTALDKKLRETEPTSA